MQQETQQIQKPMEQQTQPMQQSQDAQQHSLLYHLKCESSGSSCGTQAMPATLNII